MSAFELSAAAMWTRVVLWGFIAAATFYNAYRYRGLMLAWFIMLGVLFVFLSLSAFLRVTESPYYTIVSNLAFTPIALALAAIAAVFIINHKIRPPFNRRKEDV